jgi:replication factor C subunit 1
MKIPGNVIDQLITGAQSDIRQVLNMLSTWRLSSDTMDFDEGKQLYVSYFDFSRQDCRLINLRSAKMNEKYSIMSPFDITSKILGPYLFSPTSRETLGDKMELYFQDHSFMPLFIQVCSIFCFYCSRSPTVVCVYRKIISRHSQPNCAPSKVRKRL